VSSSFSQRAHDFFAALAITPALATAVGVREDAGRLLFPYRSSEGAIFFRERSLNGGGPAKVKQPSGEPLRLWWPFGPPRSKSALVCEGESDLLAAAESLSDCSYHELGMAAIPGTGFRVRRLAEELLARARRAERRRGARGPRRSRRPRQRTKQPRGGVDRE